MKSKIKKLSILTAAFTTVPLVVLSSCNTNQSPIDIEDWEVTSSSTTLNDFKQQVIITSNADIWSWDYDLSYGSYVTFDRENKTLTLTYEVSVASLENWTITAIYKGHTKSINLTIDYFDFDYTPYFNYIEQRSFSLHANDARGTGWIYDKVNDDVNDFKYYMLTNWHVANLMFNSGDDEITDLQYYSNISTEQDYVSFATFNMFSYDPDFQPYFNSLDSTVNQKYIIDSYLLEVDFGSSIDFQLEQSLTSLNQDYCDNGYVNKYSSTITSFGAQQYYIAGYPNGVWDYSTLQFKDATSLNPKYNEYDGGILGSDEYYRSGACYNFKANDAINMLGGSSGSMLINSDYEVIGQYWGQHLEMDWKEEGISWYLSGACLLFTAEPVYWVKYSYDFLSFWNEAIAQQKLV